MLGAIILGFLAGYLGRVFVRGSGVRGCLPTTALGMVGSLAGYFLFTEVLGVGDTELLDLGGLPGAVIGTALVLGVIRAVGRSQRRA
jgi:uncharacterized membrane protein YeaQ/YmgE (transglycosylase-associated protein family)